MKLLWGLDQDQVLLETSLVESPILGYWFSGGIYGWDQGLKTLMNDKRALLVYILSVLQNSKEY